MEPHSITNPVRMKLLYTTVEAARLLGVGRSTVYLLMGEGRLESVKVGGLRRIPAAALEEYVEALRKDQKESVPGRSARSCGAVLRYPTTG